jgi:hypothetical protein
MTVWSKIPSKVKNLQENYPFCRLSLRKTVIIVYRKAIQSAAISGPPAAVAERAFEIISLPAVSGRFRSFINRAVRPKSAWCQDQIFNVKLSTKRERTSVIFVDSVTAMFICMTQAEKQ